MFSYYLRFHQVHIKYGVNASDTVTGVLLYPDDFSFSEAGVASLPFGASNSVTELLATDWEALESAGCVFLPAAGASGTSAGTTGSYWCSTTYDSKYAYRTFFTISSMNLNLNNTFSQTNICSVRLVRNL